MGRITTFLISVFMVVCCSKEPSINFLCDDMVLDSRGHEMILKTDISVTNIFASSHEDGNTTNISNLLTNEGKTLECKGKWFTASVDKSAGKSVMLQIAANDTGKERRLEITVKHLCFQPSTVIIVQKAD